MSAHTCILSQRRDGIVGEPCAACLGPPMPMWVGLTTLTAQTLQTIGTIEIAERRLPPIIRGPWGSDTGPF